MEKIAAAPAVSGDTAVLAVSFGTSYRETREATIGAIETALENAFPQWEVRRAFTSQMIINKLKQRDGIEVDNVKEALKRAAADGIRRLVVQPTHLMDGFEYNDVKQELEAYRDAFDDLVLGAPLLDSEKDIADIIAAITDATAEYCDGQTAVAFMGHGSEAAANGIYSRLQAELRKAGFGNYYIGTVEAKPDLEDMLAAMEADASYQRVVLQPLMVVAGDHAANDMAGDEEDSWKSVLERRGYPVTCILKGLGELDAVRRMYAAHALAAMEQLRR